VRRFLDAVDAGGARLTLLTSTVLEWLMHNDDIDRFLVKPRTPSR
jgi:hypothetical protein